MCQFVLIQVQNIFFLFLLFFNCFSNLWLQGNIILSVLHFFICSCSCSPWVSLIHFPRVSLYDKVFLFIFINAKIVFTLICRKVFHIKHSQTLLLFIFILFLYSQLVINSQPLFTISHWLIPSSPTNCFVKLESIYCLRRWGLNILWW